MDQKKSHRDRIDHISGHQPHEAIQIKKLGPQEPGDQSLLSKGINDGEAICDGRKEHWKHGSGPDCLLEPQGRVCVMDHIGQHKGNDRCCKGRGCGHQEAVPQCGKKFPVSDDGPVKFQGYALVSHKGPAQEHQQRESQKQGEDSCDGPENDF